MCIPTHPRLACPRARRRWTSGCWGVCAVATGWATIISALVAGPSVSLAPLFAILIYGIAAAFLCTAWGTLYRAERHFIMGAIMFPRSLVWPALSWAGFYAPVMAVLVVLGFPGHVLLYLPAALLVSLIFGAMVVLFAAGDPA